MTYCITIERVALKSLKTIPKQAQNKIIKVIQNLAINPKPTGAKKLIGRDGWRIRIGDYRIIYAVYKDRYHILILDIGHRKDIYKNL
jgi:mRNA interferase RelE/StbE